jgi:hypothetical protein
MANMYVLSAVRNPGRTWQWCETVATKEVEAGVTDEESVAGLRPWASGLLRAGEHQGGFYHAFLVESDENGEFDTYHSMHVEDLVRFYESEYVLAG